MNWNELRNDQRRRSPSETEHIEFPHNDRTNVLYADVSVHSMPFSDLRVLEEEVWTGMRR